MVVSDQLFHDEPSDALVYRLGLIYDTCGFYFLVRTFCQSMDDLVQLFRMVAVVLTPVALAMLYEKLTAYDVFSVLGGVNAVPTIREGTFERRGHLLMRFLRVLSVPYAADDLLAVAIQSHYGSDRMRACLLMVYTSTSSGPVLSTLAAICALAMWRYRTKTKWAIWLMAFGYIALDFIMKILPISFWRASTLPVAALLASCPPNSIGLGTSFRVVVCGNGLHSSLDGVGRILE